MAVSDRPWGSFTEADYPTPENFCSAALIDLNTPGRPKAKALCKLPVKEPNGDLNRGGVHAAAGALSGARSPLVAPLDAKRAAARKLIRLYGELKEDPPEAVRQMAR